MQGDGHKRRGVETLGLVGSDAGQTHGIVGQRRDQPAVHDAA